SFEKLTFNNNIGTYSGTLTGSDGRVHELEYDLLMEDGNWKVLHIQINSPHRYAVQDNTEETETPLPSDPREFERLDLGSTVGNDGMVDKPIKSFRKDSGDIYATFYIKNGVRKTLITSEFRHLNSGSKIQPVTATIEKNGD